MYPDDRDRFWRLLEDEKVAAYICGHSHVPEIYLPDGGHVFQINASKARRPGTDATVSFFKAAVTSEKLVFTIYRDVEANGNFAVWRELAITPRGEGK